MVINIQFFGGRGASAGGGPAGSSAAPNNSSMAGPQTQSHYREQISRLSSPDYADGTYDLDTLTQVSYDSGYQVTFSQIGDNYSDAEYANKINEFLAVSSDGKTLAGKFESTPEVSFHCNDRKTAERLARKYNQISIWDWKNFEEIKTGGTGERR